MRYLIWFAILFSTASLIPESVLAEDTVIINGVEHTCTNTCVVTVTSDG